MIANPIFRKELKTTIRDPKTIAMILGFVALLSMIIVFLWPKTGVYSQRSGAGMQVFSIFLLSNLTLILLVVPALVSPSITSEREANSYELLFTSLLTPGEILRGKLFSSLGMVLLVVLVSLPISALCSLSGGIAPSLLFRAIMIIVTSAMTYGMLSLAISSLCRSTFTSLISSYLSVIFFAGCTWLPAALVNNKRFAIVVAGIRTLSPFDAMISILFPTRYQQSYFSDFAGKNPYFFFYLFLIGNLIIFGICLWIFCKYVVSPPKSGLFYSAAGWVIMILLAAALVIEGVVSFDYYKNLKEEQVNAYRPPATRTSKTKTGKKPKRPPVPVRTYDPTAEKSKQFWLIMLLMIIVDFGVFSIGRSMFRKAKTAKNQYQDHFEDTRTTVKRKLTWPFYLIDPLKRKKPIGRFRNPVFIAELRSQLFAKPRFIIYGLTTCIAVSMLLLILTCFQYGTWLTSENVLTVAIVFQVGIIAVLAPSISSGSITNEITARTFPMLRMAPMPATKMVFGKLKASFLYVSIFLISSLPVLFALAYLDYTAEIKSFVVFWRVGAWLAILLVVTINFIAAGFCCSAFSRNTSTATALSYCFAATICIITLAGLIPDAMPDNIRKITLTLNPIIVAVRLTSDELFTFLPERAWVQNIMWMTGLAAAMVLISCIRVYYIFIRRN